MALQQRKLQPCLRLVDALNWSNNCDFIKYYNIFAHNITPDSLLLRQGWLRDSDGRRLNGG